MSPVKAVEPDEVLQDPVLEARARHISEGLRCLVCQNQSIDDSAAPLAKDLRVLVRERLKAGDTDQQIEDFIVARYGEFVLLKPRFEAHTFLLWFATPAVFLTALLIVILAGLAAASPYCAERCRGTPSLRSRWSQSEPCARANWRAYLPFLNSPLDAKKSLFCIVPDRASGRCSRASCRVRLRAPKDKI